MSSTQQLLLGEGAGGGIPNYIEEVFSTWLYTGTGATQTITNNIDLSTKGGLVWTKQRSSTQSHALIDTVRGRSNALVSNTTAAQDFYSGYIGAFLSSGYTIGDDLKLNDSSTTYCSWTFRKQPKFFDVQTATSAGGVVTFNHNLGVAPGMVIIKGTNGTDNWMTYHISLGVNNYIFLNSTAAAGSYAGLFTSSSTQFSLNSLSTPTQYVAYLFAPSNSGGFGLTGTDNVISCGSFTTDGSGNATVNLGYEPQWILVKQTDGADSWRLLDNMRGMPTSGQDGKQLFPNTSAAEQTVSPTWGAPTATGFNFAYAGSSTYIYIAIRRGPMKVPTDTNNIFALNLAPDTSSSPLTWNTYSTVDSVLTKRNLSSTNGNNIFVDRVRGNSPNLLTNSTGAESSNANITDLTISNGYIQKLVSTGGAGGAITYAFSRAPGFFDIVCYTGTGSATTFSHNLSVVPELMIVKRRDDADSWFVYHANNTGSPATQYLELNSTAATSTYSGAWNNTVPTSSVFTVGSNSSVSASTYVNYLFATCAGVSKVGSYTGNGSNQTINCNFTSGVRFVLIKRTNSTGDWYVWDSARGIVAGNDPHLSLNDTAAEVTTDDSVDTNSTGFIVNQNATTNINVTSATYIFLAIA